MGLTDKSLYAYCDNNPVMRVDGDGEFWVTSVLIGAVIGITAQYVSDIIENIQEGKTGTDIFTQTSSITDYVAAGVGGAIAAVSGTSLVSALVTGAAGNIVTKAIKGNISSVQDVIEIGAKGAIANGIGFKVSKALSKLKVKKIDSMQRANKKNYLTEKVFKNSREYANANLRTFVDNPVGSVENAFFAFKNGVYATITSTSFLTTVGVINR